jgi:hypothetical protein
MGSVVISWFSQNALRGKQKKTLELPDDSSDIHLEWGGWYSDNGIYVWYRDKFSVQKCKKLVSMKWKPANLESHINFKIANNG